MNDTRRKIISLATNLALQSNKPKFIAINEAIEEACLRLDVNRKEFIKSVVGNI